MPLITALTHEACQVIATHWGGTVDIHRRTYKLLMPQEQILYHPEEEQGDGAIRYIEAYDTKPDVHCDLRYTVTVTEVP